MKIEFIKKKGMLVILMFLLSFSFVMAVQVGLEESMIGLDLSKEKQENSSLINTNSSKYWATADRGPLRNVGDIQHTWLSGLGWSSAGHTIDTDVDFNNNDLYSATNINTTNLWATTINATTGNFTDIYVSNSSIFIGEKITLSANGATGSILNVSGGNVSAEVYFGSGAYLTDIDWTAINFTNGTINANSFNGSEFTLNGTSIYDWSVFEVKSYEEIITVSTVGGSASAQSTNLIDFEITQIIVTPTTSNTNYRFEAVESTSGSMIDRNRKVHVGEWNIEKSHVINDKVNISITSASADELFTIKIKYLDNYT